MNKELDFFIKDDVPAVSAMVPDMKKRGVIVVDNAAHMFRTLDQMTEKNDHVDLHLSGGLVEDCLLHSVKRLLKPGPEELPCEVDRVVVDMTTSHAFSEEFFPLSAGGRKQMLINLLGSEFTRDPRLVILPDGE